MEDPPTITTATKRSEQQTSVTSRVKRDCISFFVSLQEGFRYFKALLVGQGKKMTARNEKEATQADLLTEKMQVEAADAAEDTKKNLHKSM
ncbi:hypothetical protein AAG906_030081 [Vitis piasezkii]|uniref:Uncharacterized protein n=1 Tax=Vitis vinifera TaxID=29760 RepID=A0A438G0E0_VITVI|nr:uncharacterized protein LOC117905896 [Vitis riparia]RVW65686.1 hypothetical protein CK203_050171 [Vitis vinifera]